MKMTSLLFIGLVLAACSPPDQTNSVDEGSQDSGEEMAATWPYATLRGQVPLIIAHRGASGYRPEHTLEAYALAIEMGADYIEPDLVLTKDGVLIARHDNYLSTTTDVAERPEFADRKKTVDGREDWFTDDFTLAEIKQLRVKQSFAGRSDAYDGQFTVPTFDEVLALVAEKTGSTSRQIGIYPETKKPSYFTAQGLDFKAPLIAALQGAGLDDTEAPVFIQSFEPGILQDLNDLIETRLVMLVFPKSEMDPTAAPGEPSVSLELAAAFADGVGPFKGLLVDQSGADSGFVQAAHDLGLEVHPWTLRDDALAPGFDDAAAEYRFWFSLGVDGIFTDFADSGVQIRDRLLKADEE